MTIREKECVVERKSRPVVQKGTGNGEVRRRGAGRKECDWGAN
jgi:hypothetical protein